MSTILANSVLNMIEVLPDKDKAAFFAEFEKLQKPVVSCKPIKIKPKVTLTLEYCVNVLRAKDSIQAQGKLA